MGYDSTFSGSLTPSKKLSDEIVKIIKDADLDVTVVTTYDDTGDCDGDLGDVVPSMRTMHGYNIEKDILKVQRLLDKQDIKLDGTIERSGENAGDFSLVEVDKGKVYVRQGEITYGDRMPVTVKDITSYAVRVYKVRKHARGEFKGCTEKEFVGWMTPPCLSGNAPDLPYVESSNYRIPPYTAFSADKLKEAQKAAEKFNLKGYEAEVTKWVSAL